MADSNRWNLFTWPQRRGWGRAVLLAVAGAAALAGAGYGVQLWRYWDRHVSTDDAFVEARVSPFSAKLRGTVVEVLVRDNQTVVEGQVLVRLDPRDWQVKLEQARAAVAMARSRLQAAASGVPLTDESTRSQVAQVEAALGRARLGVDLARRVLEERTARLRARRAAVQVARAELRARQADFDRARLDRERTEVLIRRELVARQEFDHAEAAFMTAKAGLDAATQRLDMALAEVAQAEAEVASEEITLAQARHGLEEAAAGLVGARSRRREVAIREADAAGAEAQLGEALASLREAELGVEDTTIRAPMGGRVTKKTVEVGQVVQPGQPLLAVVNLDDLWIVANYKETQLTHVRPGQPAEIRVDTYPDLVLRARVDSIQSGTGSRFSLLPAENASGNFVKVVQRVPVKLVIEPGEKGRTLLVPGMSVVPTIRVR
jgi:membrane fusion protein (multidrug efflux system)